VRAPGFLFFVLYYGVLIAVCAGWFRHKARRWILLAGTVSLAGLWFMQWQRERAWHRVIVLPLGDAHAVHVQPAHGQGAWLINCGNRNAVDFILKPFLQAQGANEIRRLVLTHGDANFVSGATRLMLPVRETFVSPITFRSTRYREVVSELEIRSTLHRSATNGFASPPWKILHPNGADRFPAPGDNAVIALGTFDDLRVLVVPDLGKAGQNAIYARHPELRADVVIAGLPDNEEPLASEWLDVIQPKLIVLADSDFPAVQRGSASLLARLRRNGREVISTRAAGAVTISIHGRQCRIKTARQVIGRDEVDAEL
jgi:beta-lactamase superfamily II metal-dependent hydrolase